MGKLAISLPNMKHSIKFTCSIDGSSCFPKEPYHPFLEPDHRLRGSHTKKNPFSRRKANRKWVMSTADNREGARACCGMQGVLTYCVVQP